MTPNGRTLYVADWGHTVTPVNVATGQPGTPIRVGNEPRAMVITPNGRTLFVAAHDGTVTRVDTTTNRPMAVIRFHGFAGMAVSPDGRTLYVAPDPPGNVVVPVDVATGKRGTPFVVASGTGPLVVTPDGRILYVAGLNGVTPVATATGRSMQFIQVSVGWPSVTALAITPNGRTVYAAVNGDVGPDLQGRHVVVPISTATNTPGTPITVGHGPVALAISPDGSTLYVCDADDGTVMPVAVATGQPGSAVRVGWIFINPGPQALAITPAGRTLYVADDSSVAAVPLAGVMRRAAG